MMNRNLVKDRLKTLFEHQEENLSLLRPFGIVKNSVDIEVKEKLLRKKVTELDDLIINEACLGQLVKDINHLSALKNQLTTFMHQVVAQQNEMIAKIQHVTC